MPNILINPNSGLMEFTTGTAGGSTFNTNFTGGAFVNRMSYDNYGGLNLTSYVSNITGLDRFTVDGANGRLFSVTDNLSGSLFSVNDIAGLPIIEAFDDNTVIMGAFNRNDFTLTGNSLGLGGLPNTGTTKLYVSGNVLISGILAVSGSQALFQYPPLVSGKEVYYQKNIVYSSGISFTPDYVSGRNFVYTLTGFSTTYNTINNPINVPEGETIIIKVIQSNYGNNFLIFGNNYRFPADASPLITQGSGKFDIFNILKLDNRFITTYIKNFSN